MIDPPMEQRKIHFAIVLVEETPLEAIRQKICAVLECARRNSGDVLSFGASEILIAFGMDGDGVEADEALSAFVGDLQKTIGKNVSLVYGAREALVGVVGTEYRKSVTFLFKGYGDCLRELVALPPGESKEV